MCDQGAKGPRGQGGKGPRAKGPRGQGAKEPRDQNIWYMFMAVMVNVLLDDEVVRALISKIVGTVLLIELSWFSSIRPVTLSLYEPLPVVEFGENKKLYEMCVVPGFPTVFAQNIISRFHASFTSLAGTLIVIVYIWDEFNRPKVTRSLPVKTGGSNREHESITPITRGDVPRPNQSVC